MCILNFGRQQVNLAKVRIKEKVSSKLFTVLTFLRALIKLKTFLKNNSLTFIMFKGTCTYICMGKNKNQINIEIHNSSYEVLGLSEDSRKHELFIYIYP